METSAYITSIFAGSFYLIASYRLLRLSRQTGERPEFWLGIYFAAAGQWYVLFNAPYFFGLGTAPPLLEYWVELIYAVGVVPYLLFLRSAFRPRSRWATALTGGSALLLLTGAGIAGVRGHFSSEIGDPAYLLEWIGYTVPSCWMCAESLASHASAQKRVRMKICSPIVANRYLLFAGFGSCQLAACAADIIATLGNTSAKLYSSFAIGLLSGAEFASVAFLWLAFFPPLSYRRWIEGRAGVLASTAEV